MAATAQAGFPRNSPSIKDISSRLEHTPSLLLELVSFCARSSLDPGTAARFGEIVAHVKDWRHLTSQALSHGVLPLLYARLQATCHDAVPGAVLLEMRQTFDQNSRRHSQLLAELFRLLDRFASHSLPVLAFGGPILAEACYPSPTLRYAGEPHLLILPDARRPAEDLLLAEGYRRIQYAPSEQQEYFLGPPCEQVFVRPGDQSGVVLRTSLVPRHFSVRLGARDVWQGRTAVSLRGRDVPTLSAEDFLLVHCLDAAKLGWEHLGSVCDTTAFLHSHPQLDWPLLFQHTRSSGAGRALRLGLWLAADWLSTPLPPDLNRSLAADRTVYSLASAIRSRLFQQEKEASNPLASSRFHFRVQSSLLAGLRYALRAALTPTSGDWRFLSFPRPLFPLYYLVRPARIATQLTCRAFRGSVADLAPYVSSPMEITLGMLALAEVGFGDVVYDIGCGDGRLVIEAARRYGARGVGVDLDPRLIAKARANARRAGVEDRVTLLEQDAESLDLSSATVVMLYLLPATNLRLRHRLQQQLRPGARVVSHRFDMGDWPPHRTEVITLHDGASHSLYLWRI